MRPFKCNKSAWSKASLDHAEMPFTIGFACCGLDTSTTCMRFVSSLPVLRDPQIPAASDPQPHISNTKKEPHHESRSIWICFHLRSSIDDKLGYHAWIYYSSKRLAEPRTSRTFSATSGTMIRIMCKKLPSPSRG